jgi:hypothetical protein
VRTITFVVEIPEIKKPSLIALTAMVLPGVEAVEVITSAVKELPEYTVKQEEGET